MSIHAGQSDHDSPRIPVLMIAALVVLSGILGAVWLFQASHLKPNEILVTYENGAKCKWVDWSFRYRRIVSNNQARGNIAIVGPGTQEIEDDTTLRVFSTSGEKLAIPALDLREINFVVRPNENNSYENEVIAMTVETTTRTFRFEAEPLPKFSRSRVLVPVASHYFAEQSDDYMSWGNARLSLVGMIPQSCESDRPISLTRTDHSKKRTPIQIRFAGS